MQTIESRKEKLAALKTKIADFAIWEEGFNKRLDFVDERLKELKAQVNDIRNEVRDLRHEAE